MVNFLKFTHTFKHAKYTKLRKLFTKNSRIFTVQINASMPKALMNGREPLDLNNEKNLLANILKFYTLLFFPMNVLCQFPISIHAH